MNSYFNRELSWLEFNKRVLGESFEKENPLAEQLNFLSIFSSNLDEFFMVRVGSLWDQLRSGEMIKDISGYTAEEQIELINEVTKKMVVTQYDRYKELKLEMKKQKVLIVSYDQLTQSEKNKADIFYRKNIYPLVTPTVIDKNGSFPLIANKTINLFLLLEKNGKTRYGNVQVPYQVNRLVEIKKNSLRKFITIESLLRHKLVNLYPTYKIKEVSIYRLTRNADLDYDEEEAQDLLVKIENSIQKRKWGKAVRLELEENPSDTVLEIFKNKFLILDRELYILNDVLDLTFLNFFIKKKWFAKNRFKLFTPNKVIETANSNIFFKWISKKDRVYHLPYDDFSAILALINLSARDEKVLAIKQTLYRVSKNSPIIGALELAAKNGKNVTVLLELKARFDEENNIHWSKRLEKAGVHVIHGPRKLKTHLKILLVLRKEKEVGIRTYCHLATGNYNEKTATVYEDVGLFTADQKIGADCVEIFNFLASQTLVRDLSTLIISPYQTRDYFKKLICFEIAEALKGNKSHIRAKINSFVDKPIMDLLYEAASAGVKIELVVRGICTLIPNNNIIIKSIVGRFLEHSRLYYFYHGGLEKTFISSLDWMERNFDKRVELLIPIVETDAKRKIINILEKLWEDTEKSYFLSPDGTYVKEKKKHGFNAQNYFLTHKEQ